MDAKWRWVLMGAAVIAAVCVTAGLWMGRTTEAVPAQAWFVDLTSGKVFADHVDRLVPFQNEAGHVCVLGRFADCGGRRLLLYYEKFSDASLPAALQATDSQTLADLMQRGWLVSRDGVTWAQASGPDGIALMEEAGQAAAADCGENFRISLPGR